MSTETVEVVFRESGSANVAANTRKIGDAAGVTQGQMNQLLSMLGNSNLKMAEVARASGSMEAAMLRAHGAAGTLGGGLHGITGEANLAAEGASHLKEILIGLGLALGAKEWVELTDAYTKNFNAMRQVTGGTVELRAVQEALFEVSQKTHTSMDANVALFTSMSKASTNLKLTQQDMLRVIEVINQNFRLQGTSSEEASGALRRLAVSFSTGQIQGRGLLTLFLQMPELTRRLAASFFSGSDAVERFKTAASNGTITVKQIAQAMSNLSGDAVHVDQSWRTMTTTMDKFSAEAATASGSSQHLSQSILVLEDESAKMAQKIQVLADESGQAHEALASVGDAQVVSAINRVSASVLQIEGDSKKLDVATKALKVTVGEAWQNMKNAIGEYVGKADEASGISQKLAGAIQFVAEHANVFLGVLGVVTAALTAFIVVAGGGAIAAAALSAALAPIALVVAGIVAAGAALVIWGRENFEVMGHNVNVMGILLGVEKSLEQALVYLWNLLRSGVELLGGPFIGAIRFVVNLFHDWFGTTSDVSTAFSNLVGWLQSAYDWVVQMLDKVPGLNAVLSVLGGIASKVGDGFAAMKDTVVKNIDESSRSLVKMKETADVWKNGVVEDIQVVNSATSKMNNVFQKAYEDMIGRYQKASKAEEDYTSDVEKGYAQMNTAASNYEKEEQARQAAIAKSMEENLKRIREFERISADNAAHSFGGDDAYGLIQHKRQADGTFAFGPLERLVSYQSVQMDDLKKLQAGDTQAAARLKNVWDSNLGVPNGANTLMTAAGITALLKNFYPNDPNLAQFGTGGSFNVGGAGGTDNNLVQFMASKHERVTVETPEQVRRNDAKNNGDVHVHMTVITPDTHGFSRTQPQIIAGLKSKLTRAGLAGA